MGAWNSSREPILQLSELSVARPLRITQLMAAKLSRCSACGWSNSDMRDVCLNCGVTLDKTTEDVSKILESVLLSSGRIFRQLRESASKLRQYLQSRSSVAAVFFALLIGFFVGNQSVHEPLESRPRYYFQSDGLRGGTGYESEDIEETRIRLEEARDRAEEARDAADELAFQARMRWIESGSFGDLMRMHSAEDALDRAEESLNSIDDALSGLK